MDLKSLSFVEIVDIRDDRLLPWLDLYETSFPATERVLVSFVMNVLKRKMDGEEVDDHLLSIGDDNDTPIGMTMFSASSDSPAAFLWYVAVDPNRRDGGFGTLIYQEILKRVSTPSRQALVYEVEIPDGHDVNAQRRIRFYQRQGAYLLKGIRYMQHVGWHQPPIPMHVMIHPFQSMDAQQAFNLAKEVFEDSMEQVGTLELE